MNFEAALTAMRQGQKVRRPSFGSIQARYSIKLNEDQTDFNRVSPSGASTWQASTADILATDWQAA